MKNELAFADKLKTMSISEIENYGSDIQELMSETSNNILNKTSMFEIGDTKEELDKLSEAARKQTKMLPVLQTPMRKLRGFTGRFDKIQTRITDIGNNLSKQRDKLTKHIEYMEEQTESLHDVVSKLNICENELKVYLDTSNEEDDSLRYQAVASRLRMLNGTRIIAEQALAEALMIIAEQREAKNQLDQVIKNALPAIQIQAVNSVGIRVNKETQDIISKTREITGQILVQNANDVKNMAVELQKNRTKSIVDDEKLMKAQDILNEALDVVMKAAENETESNIKLVKSLSEKAADNQKYINILSNKLS